MKSLSLIFLLVITCVSSAYSLSSVNPSVVRTTNPTLDSCDMLAIGRGNRSILFKHHRLLQKNIIRNREKLFITLAVALSEDERYEAVPKEKRKSPVYRTRAKVKDMFETLGSFARRSYRMTFESFVKLFRRVKDNLRETFIPSGGHRCDRMNIKLSLRLSCAIRWFANGSTYDIMLNHGLSHNEVYESVWGCVDAVNKCKYFDFPGFSHEKQREYAKGFYDKSTAGFDTVISAVDGMLVWKRCPTEAECEIAKTGQEKFKCGRKGILHFKF